MLNFNVEVPQRIVTTFMEIRGQTLDYSTQVLHRVARQFETVRTPTGIGKQCLTTEGTSK